MSAALKLQLALSGTLLCALCCICLDPPAPRRCSAPPSLPLTRSTGLCTLPLSPEWCAGAAHMLAAASGEPSSAGAPGCHAALCPWPVLPWLLAGVLPVLCSAAPACARAPCESGEARLDVAGVAAPPECGPPLWGGDSSGWDSSGTRPRLLMIARVSHAAPPPRACRCFPVAAVPRFVGEVAVLLAPLRGGGGDAAPPSPRGDPVVARAVCGRGDRFARTRLNWPLSFHSGSATSAAEAGRLVCVLVRAADGAGDAAALRVASRLADASAVEISAVS